MSHELSESIGTPEGYGLNINGHTGMPLPPVWPFEQEVYSSIPNADAAAEARSNLFTQLVNAIANQPLQAQRLGLPTPFPYKVLPQTLSDAERHLDSRTPHIP